jgi:hypothetical protein
MKVVTLVTAELGVATSADAPQELKPNIISGFDAAAKAAPFQRQENGGMD